MELASLCPTNLSSLFSRTKLLEIFDKSVVFCGFPKHSFKSGGEGAPVTRPPLDLVFSLHGSDGVFWQLLMLSASFWTETEVLNDPAEVNRDEDTVGKDNTPEIKKLWGYPSNESSLLQNISQVKLQVSQWNYCSKHHKHILRCAQYCPILTQSAH